MRHRMLIQPPRAASETLGQHAPAGTDGRKTGALPLPLTVTREFTEMTNEDRDYIDGVLRDVQARLREYHAYSEHMRHTYGRGMNERSGPFPTESLIEQCDEACSKLGADTN